MTRKKENYKFFQNKSCEYWMCHKGINKDNFSCLFCYCPVFYHCALKDKIPCERCIFPHRRNNYDRMMLEISIIHEASAAQKQ
jgi:Zn-finger protein